MFTISEAQKAQLAELDKEIAALRQRGRELDDEKARVLFPALDGWGELQSAIRAVETSTEYYFNEFGEVNRYVELDMHLLPHDYKEALRVYLDEKTEGVVFPNFGQNVLDTTEGDCILVQLEHGRDDGVYYENKCILNPSDFESETDLYASIETWMEKNGVFPPVLQVSQGGNLSLINTLEYKKGE